VSTLPSNFPLGLSTSTAAAAASPYIERFEAVAADGKSDGLSNQWGGHQTRVTHHSDGSVRVLYLRSGVNGMLNWRLMKRPAGATAVWTQEASGLSTDDVTLSRDPVSDVAHVTAWPDSVPTTYSSPSFAANAIPGTWVKMSSSSRHYGNTGIGPDGTLCLKVSVETSSTADTSTQYACGKYDAPNKRWSWNKQVSKSVGLRRAYDYVFPGGSGDKNSLVATSQLDVLKSVAGLQSLAVTAGNYVFNGVTQFTTGTADTASWTIGQIVDSYYAPPTATAPPYVKQIDSFVDSKKRVLTTYWVDDPLQATPKGFYLSASDATGKVLFKSQWTALPTYGAVRIFEDASARLWLLWTNQGSQITQMTLYRINETSSPLGFSLGTKTDLASKLAPYSITGSTQLALQRGGQTVGNALDGVMLACDGTYAAGKSLVCEPNGLNKQRIFHFRVRLPN